MAVYSCCNVEDTLDNFVGIKYLLKEIKIIFPLGYQIPNTKKEQIKAIKDLIKTIKLVHDQKIFLEDTGIYEKEAEGMPMDSFMWVINDYLENGLYFDNEKTYIQDNKGKINWRKTFKTMAYISKNGAVYLNPIVEKRNKVNNLLSEIQAFAIDKSNEYIGFLYGNIPRLSVIKNSPKYYLNIVNKEMLSSFDDRKKMLLYHLKRILNFHMKLDSSNQLQDYGTRDYEYAFEYMVDKVFGTEKVSKYYPKAKYILDKKTYETSNLRPDTIFLDYNNLYILDSKYYKAAVVASSYEKLSAMLPNTSAITKQITYGEFINYNFKPHNIYNVFILPYNKSQNNFNLHENIEKIGYAECDWQDMGLKKIFVILIDTKYLMDLYFQKITNREELISKIR